MVAEIPAPRGIPGNIGQVTRSPVPYFGGKSWLAPRLAAVLPPHKHYVEVCGGSLARLAGQAAEQARNSQ